MGTQEGRTFQTGGTGYTKVNGTNTSKAAMCKVKRIVGGDEVRRG